MAVEAHTTAIIDPKAELGEGVQVGAYSVIGPEVKIGDNTKVWHQASIWGNTEIGESCEIYPFASIGMKTQDLKFQGGSPQCNSRICIHKCGNQRRRIHGDWR